MLSKRFQKQLIKEIARLVTRRTAAEVRAKSANDDVTVIDVEINKLKSQLGFDPEKELQLASVDSSSDGEQQQEETGDVDLTPPAFLQRKQA